MTERSVFKNPVTIIEQQRQIIKQLKERIERELNHQAINQKRQLKFLCDNLKALNPFSILERGYAYIESSENKTIDSVNKISIGQKIKIHWSDGKATAEINEINKIMYQE